MEQTLVLIVVLVVVVLIALALVRWMGVQIPPIAVQIFWILVAGILVVTIIRFLWPLLWSGLRVGMAAPIGPLIGVG
jgi:hypothetical protein